MLLAASVLLIGGYTLLYAGVKGIEWSQPWNILIANSKGPAQVTPIDPATGGVASPTGGSVVQGPPVPGAPGSIDPTTGREILGPPVPGAPGSSVFP